MVRQRILCNRSLNLCWDISIHSVYCYVSLMNQVCSMPVISIPPTMYCLSTSLTIFNIYFTSIWNRAETRKGEKIDMFQCRQGRNKPRCLVWWPLYRGDERAITDSEIYSYSNTVWKSPTTQLTPKCKSRLVSMAHFCRTYSNKGLICTYMRTHIEQS